jgi:hypothetical protein
MRYQKPLAWLIPLIGILALVAAGAGLFWETEGAPYQLTSFRGEAVTIQGHGLYRYDTVSTAAQEQANDLVTLVLALPLLAISSGLARRGSLRGQLLLTGTLGYVLYTYMSMSFLTAYNQLFLLYVALFSLSLFAFILSMLTYDLGALPGRFSTHLPRRSIAGVLFAAGGFLLLAWLGRIAPTITQGQIPPLENTTTLVIQAMDLGLIVPLCVLAGILLLRRSAWGYLLASVAVMKMLTLGAAVSLMALNMLRLGAPISVVELVVFPGLTLANAVVAALLLKSVRTEVAQAIPARPQHA